ncbi:MAG: lipid-A-disaccharide synthase, partial [Thermodesulfobacteriota bacterium]|nr:lipid-A-disaccharide synthase [Thermodesulfobacteriota bacterium]
MNRKNSSNGIRIMISTGEASGDLHGAGLISAIKRLVPDVDVCGIGGKALQGQGVELLHDVSCLAVTGFIEVFSHLSDIRAAKNAMERRLKEWRPHLLILIDYPDFNLMLAKKAKRLGIPILYYISPQVW